MLHIKADYGNNKQNFIYIAHFRWKHNVLKKACVTTAVTATKILH